MKSTSFVTLVVVAAISSSALAGGFTFQGLGDLPGGSFNSVSTGLSADGTVVVGTSNSAKGPQAFCWTAAGSGTGGATAVPEPSSLALAAIALFGLVGCVHRSRRR